MVKETISTKVPLNDKRIINGWAFFDWANSSYALVIAVAIFPVYFNEVVTDEFSFLGMQMTDSSLFSYSISLAYIVVVAALPLLSGIADYGGKKLFFMKMFTTLGSFACMSLFFFTGMDKLWLGLTGFILAVIGFAGGQVFYNSFLPVIASEDQYDKVSAKGFSYGYIGSVILLVANLVMIQKPEWFGLAGAGIATRISFVMVGLWWIGFAQISFRRLPKDPKNMPTEGLLSKGYKEIKKVWQAVKQQTNTKRFLMAFFFYSAGVQTLIYLASTFGKAELKFGTTELIILILILQIVAIGGAYLFAKVSDIKGNKFALIAMLLIWIGICVVSYFVTGKTEFYVIAGFVGLVMGGIQSLSRSTYSKLIPETDDTASYFSFFDVLEKSAIVIGTFSFGIIDQLTGGMRNSILSLAVFFLIGILILSTVNIKKAQLEN